MTSGRSAGPAVARWPVFFGLFLAITVVAVTVGLAIHRNRAPVARQADPGKPVPVLPQAVPSSAGAGPRDRSGAGSGREERMHSLVAELVSRRAKLRAKESARTERMRDAAASRFANEVRDPAWAFAQARARARIAAELSAAGLELPPDLATQCKRTVCRTTATFASANQADEWVLLYMASLGNAAQRSVVSRSRDAGGATRLDIYSMSDR